MFGVQECWAYQAGLHKTEFERWESKTGGYSYCRKIKTVAVYD